MDDLIEFSEGETTPPTKTEVMRARIAAASVPANEDIKNYYHVSEEQIIAESDSWTMKPEIPSSDEVMSLGPSREIDDGTTACLPRNNISRGWPSTEEYLEIHHTLLREDAVAPLRDAVAYVRDDPRMKDSPGVSIYEKVHIVGITYNRKEVAFRIRFSTRRAGKNIIWEYSNRLKSGSIVALSGADDRFKTECVVAVVAARPLENLKKHPPEVDIYFAEPREAAFDPHKEWIMVEAKNGYYEALRHTMTALQKMSRESFPYPFERQIVHLIPGIVPPWYIENKPELKVASVINETEDEDTTHVLYDWPKSPMNEPMADMDHSQWVALEHILTRALAIVQGPPGTGKTFVSVTALKILLANKDGADPPIIVAAQTNHALDQLLTHISAFEKNFIRLGGRSSDVDIKRRTLHSVKKNEAMPIVAGGLLGPSVRKFQELHYRILDLLQDFNVDPRKELDILPASFFAKHGIITETQEKSLIDGAEGWVINGQPEDRGPMIVWLGESAAEFKVDYQIPETFGFQEDEIDLEYEQLKELEAEQGIGIEDDQLETLKGEYCPIEERYVGQEIGWIHKPAIQEYVRYNDLWNVPARERGAVYNVFCKMAKEKITEDLRTLLVLYKINGVNMQISKWEKDHVLLKHANVIGMTTTGLSKYRALISSLKPKVVLIEEAAEILEAPVAAACFESLEHLILVGDHKQLKGSCSVQDLKGDPFNLDVSMFERLVENEIPFVTLQQQRRMLPEMRRLLEPIYGRLRDHPSVRNRPNVPGMGNVKLFFFNHDWPENSDSLSSKVNNVEAQLVAEFFVYLILNGVPAPKITILTFYNGQRKKLLKLLREHPLLGAFYLKVATVDSYQGEEDDIIILSLVRSGNTRNIGFLAQYNRTCVALSRAKRGLYIFGNAECLAGADQLWSVVTTMLRCYVGDTPSDRRLGNAIPLTCEKHGTKTFADDPIQLNKLNGGCHLPCDENLDCGHKCKARCHAFSHDQFKCDEICGKTWVCGHSCEEPCAKYHDCRCKCPVFSTHAAQTKYESARQSEAGPIEPDVAPEAQNENVPSPTTVRQGILIPDLDIVEDQKQQPKQQPKQQSRKQQKQQRKQQQKQEKKQKQKQEQKQHEALVQRYRDFANGGAKEQDARLLAKYEAELGHAQRTGLKTLDPASKEKEPNAEEEDKGDGGNNREGVSEKSNEGDDEGFSDDDGEGYSEEDGEEDSGGAGSEKGDSADGKERDEGKSSDPFSGPWIEDDDYGSYDDGESDYYGGKYSKPCSEGARREYYRKKYFERHPNEKIETRTETHTETHTGSSIGTPGETQAETHSEAQSQTQIKLQTKKPNDSGSSVIEQANKKDTRTEWSKGYDSGYEAAYENGQGKGWLDGFDYGWQDGYWAGSDGAAKLNWGERYKRAHKIKYAAFEKMKSSQKQNEDKKSDKYDALRTEGRTGRSEQVIDTPGNMKDEHRNEESAYVPSYNLLDLRLSPVRKTLGSANGDDDVPFTPSNLPPTGKLLDLY